jgi:hypothetical protein
MKVVLVLMFKLYVYHKCLNFSLSYSAVSVLLLLFLHP